MDKEEFTKDMAYLGLAFNKNYTPVEIEQHYDFLKDYNDSVFMTAIKELIKTSQFLPKIKDLIEACEKSKETTKFEILELMQQDNYFKSSLEYEKASRWLEKGIIPGWFKEDMKMYYQRLKQRQLESKSRLLLDE